MNVLVKVINSSIVHQGNIYKKGDEFELDSIIAESLEKEGYVQSFQEGEFVEGNLASDDLESMSYQDLKKLASDLGVTAKGSKEELIQKIIDTKNEVTVEEKVPEEDDEEVEGEIPNTSMPE